MRYFYISIDIFYYQMAKKSIKTKIAEYFYLNPAVKLRVRQIERQVKVPLPSAIKYAKELEKERILKSEIIANIKIYSANRTSNNYLLEKKFFNLKQLHHSNLIIYLVEKYHNPSLILFGSYSRGEDLEESDIDIYVETASKKKINLDKFENKLQRKVQLFTYKNIKSIKNKDLANNIINGSLLNGFVEVFK